VWFYSSNIFDLKWRNKKNIPFSKLRPHQIVNHVMGVRCLGNKALCCFHLRCLSFTHNVDCDMFYPRCWKLDGEQSTRAYVQYAAYAASLSILECFLHRTTSCSHDGVVISCAFTVCEKYLEMLLSRKVSVSFVSVKF
jgi:hypothetical protein